jgi:ABC-2 type transport system permease protein
VAPVSRAAIVLGKVMGGTSLAVAQAALFLLLGPTIGIHLTAEGILAEIAAMILVAFAMTCLGFWVAWRMESTQGFHAVMNLVLMPMLVMSGAFFPPSGSATWLNWIVRINPTTYGVCLLREALYLGGPPARSVEVAGPGPALAISVLFALVMFGLSMKLVNRGGSQAVQ